MKVDPYQEEKWKEKQVGKVNVIIWTSQLLAVADVKGKKRTM